MVENLTVPHKMRLLAWIQAEYWFDLNRGDRYDELLHGITPIKDYDAERLDWELDEITDSMTLEEIAEAIADTEGKTGP